MYPEAIISFFLMLVLGLQGSISQAVLHGTGPAKIKRFSDILADARKTAIDDFLDRALGNHKRTSDENYRRNGQNSPLKDLEQLIYSRKLQMLLKKSCTDWWCFGDKATSPTPATTTSTSPTESTAAAETVPTTTPTTTPTTKSTVLAAWNLPNWLFWNYFPKFTSWSYGGWLKRKRKLSKLQS